MIMNGFYLAVAFLVTMGNVDSIFILLPILQVISGTVGGLLDQVSLMVLYQDEQLIMATLILQGLA